jgi:hypothetical protein
MQDGLKNKISAVSGRRLKYILMFLVLLLCFLNIHVWLLSYSDFINFWADKFNVSGSLNKIKKSFSPDNYFILRIHAIALQIILFGVLIYAFKRAAKLHALFAELIHSFNSVFHSIINSLSALSKIQKIFLCSAFTIFLIRNILLLFYLPFDIDEIWSYMAFKNKNPVFTLLWYPIPGNHILYSFLSHSALKIDNSFHYLLRVPAVLSSTLSFVVLFFLLQKLFRFRTAIAGLIIFYSFGPVIFYSIAARGYGLNILCTLILIGSIYRIIFYSDKRFVYIGIIASALGIYSIPTFIYNLASVMACWLIFILLYKKSDLRLLVQFCLATFLISYLLYMPAFIFSGYSAIFKNGWVVSKDIYEIAKSFGDHYSHAATWLISGNTFDIFIVIFAIMLGVVFTFLAKNREHAFILLISVALLTLPYLFSILQRVLIPPSILTYTCFALSVIIVYIFFMLDSVIPDLLLSRALTVILIILISLPLHLYFKKFYEKEFYHYHHANRISVFLSGQAKNYFFNHSYYPYIFEFYLARHNLLHTINLTPNADSADVITILKTGDPLLNNNPDKSFDLIYNDSKTAIYKKKNYE